MLNLTEQDLQAFEKFLLKFPGEFCNPVLSYLRELIIAQHKAKQENTKEVVEEKPVEADVV